MVEILGIVLLIFRFILADFNKIIDDLKFKIHQKDPVVAFFGNDAKHFYFFIYSSTNTLISAIGHLKVK